MLYSVSEILPLARQLYAFSSALFPSFLNLKKKKKQWNSLLAFFFPKQNLTWKLRNVGTHSREG